MIAVLMRLDTPDSVDEKFHRKVRAYKKSKRVSGTDLPERDKIKSPLF
jgi:hypothetical protein